MYSVYTLLDTSGNIFYVGCTNDLDSRLIEHVANSKSGIPNDKDNRILEILNKGGYPVIKEIERFENEKDAKKSEAYWIKKLISEGHNLCNILHGICKQQSTRKRLKICLVCGRDHEGTEAKITCSTACRSAMSRMLAKGKKPEYWLIAKSKGQKIPLFFAAPKIKKEKQEDRLNIKFTESTEESYDGNKLDRYVLDEIGLTEPMQSLTTEQKLAKEVEINNRIAKIKREVCPNGQHPKHFKLTQEVRIEELNELLSKIK